MSDIIRLLPDSVANQIAAGEVIQRPASVVKELVENAVDAGATTVDVVITDAGRTLIQVIDNGKGMTETDARMAFERHATSKIAKADDLFALHTMGFRGEALPSIAAVSQVELRTRREDDNVGTLLRIAASRVEAQEPVAAARGSNFMIRNLFYNFPARRKFLKKDSVEFAAIAREFERLALVNPELTFSLSHNGEPVHRLAAGSLKQRIGQLFGKSLEERLLPVELHTQIVEVSGYVGLPETCRSRNPLQYLFVNGRNMRHPYFHKAVVQPFESIVTQDKQPNYFLNLTVDPAKIDVNIHPTKNEIKFEDEAAIWPMLRAAVAEVLGRFNASPAMDFDMADAPEIPAFGAVEAPLTVPDTGVTDPMYNPFGRSESPRRGMTARPHNDPLRDMTRDWERLYEGFSSKQAAGVVGMSGQQSNLGDDSSDVDRLPFESTATPGCIQVAGRYILSPTSRGVMLVDRYRASVRILYERYMAMPRDGMSTAQRVMFAELIQLTPAQEAVMRCVVDELSSLGFDVADMGGGDWSVNSIPADIPGVRAREVIMGMIEDAESGLTSTGDELRRRVALGLARAGAIHSGENLTDAEADHLLSELLRLPTPNYTPDGLPVLRVLDAGEIASLL